MTVIGVAYSDALDPLALAVAAAALAALALFSRLGQWRASVYVVLAVVLWLATVDSGLHPSIAGMAAGLVIAARPPRRQEVEQAASLFRAFRQARGCPA